MYKTLHKKQGSVTVQLRFARSSVTFCAKRDNISYLNRVSRHIEHSELTENSLNDRVFYKEESLEETVSRCIEYELLHKAISKLPETQRRRLLLYFFGELSYEQIAKLEGCTKMAVKGSVDIALKKLKKLFEKF